MFEWSARYLMSERSEQVRYRVEHEKIKFISIFKASMEYSVYYINTSEIPNQLAFKGVIYYAPVAQLIEHRSVTREVVSSTPVGPTLRVLK